eukprot:m.418148 g.418148  ORF g.418148 m.418148 type:complete len:59 (-) comp30768_c0_seq1:410-586(-)
MVRWLHFELLCSNVHVSGSDAWSVETSAIDMQTTPCQQKTFFLAVVVLSCGLTVLLDA